MVWLRLIIIADAISQQPLILLAFLKQVGVRVGARVRARV
jgi:hypothetical protein